MLTYSDVAVEYRAAKTEEISRYFARRLPTTVSEPMDVPSVCSVCTGVRCPLEANLAPLGVRERGAGGVEKEAGPKMDSSSRIASLDKKLIRKRASARSCS